MTNVDEAAEFYEDDEPIEGLIAAYERGNVGKTAPPEGWAPVQQSTRSDNFRSFAPGVVPTAAPVWDRARSGQLVQA